MRSWSRGCAMSSWPNGWILAVPGGLITIKGVTEFSVAVFPAWMRCPAANPSHTNDVSCRQATSPGSGSGPWRSVLQIFGPQGTCSLKTFKCKPADPADSRRVNPIDRKYLRTQVPVRRGTFAHSQHINNPPTRNRDLRLRESNNRSTNLSQRSEQDNQPGDSR